MGTTSTAVAIATMANATCHHYHHHYGEDVGKQLLAIVLAILTLSVLWIVFTSVRQLIRKDKYYDFIEENIGALVAIAVILALNGFIALAEFIYFLIK